METFDAEKRSALLRKIAAQTAATALPAVVGLEDFFDGNRDYGSLGCNLTEHPGPDGFFRRLRLVRDRPDVQDVLVEIAEVDDGQWPFSERVYVLAAAASRDEVAVWLAPLRPDEVGAGYPHGVPPPPPAFPAPAPGIAVYAAWWD